MLLFWMWLTIQIRMGSCWFVPWMTKSTVQVASSRRRRGGNTNVSLGSWFTYGLCTAMWHTRRGMWINEAAYFVRYFSSSCDLTWLLCDWIFYITVHTFKVHNFGNAKACAWMSSMLAIHSQGSSNRFRLKIFYVWYLLSNYYAQVIDCEEKQRCYFCRLKTILAKRALWSKPKIMLLLYGCTAYN
jgi:hypothetical protein